MIHETFSANIDEDKNKLLVSLPNCINITKKKYDRKKITQ
ncbi:MAG: hypothetical protein ACJA1Z_001392 [Patiriisocius sp.]|jgi:hypothetical protein